MRRDVADWHVLEWPVTTGEDLCVEFNVADEAGTIVLLVSEILDCVL